MFFVTSIFFSSHYGDNMLTSGTNTLPCGPPWWNSESQCQIYKLKGPVVLLLSLGVILVVTQTRGPPNELPLLLNFIHAYYDTFFLLPKRWYQWKDHCEGITLRLVARTQTSRGKRVGSKIMPPTSILEQCLNTNGIVSSHTSARPQDSLVFRSSHIKSITRHNQHFFS